MSPCVCRYFNNGVCAREAGTLPAKSRDIFCLGRPVVPRHEPTLPRSPYGETISYKHMEPIADE